MPFWRIKINTIDFYSGFEGEPEITIAYSGPAGTEVAIRIWSGYFDSLINAIEPESSGWTGLALPFHLEKGWYIAPWKIPDLKKVVEQIEKIDTRKVDELMRDSVDEIRSALLRILRLAIEQSKEVFIRYD